MSDVRADLKEQGNGVLSHDLGSVGGNVDDRDSLFSCIFEICDIVAGRKDRDGLEIGAKVDGLRADRCFVRDSDLSIADSLGNDRGFHIGSPVVNGQFSKSGQLFPAQISRILRVAV